DEVKQLYLLGYGSLTKPPNNLGLVGYWPFDEVTGTTFTDHSGNGNTGTGVAGLSPSSGNGKHGKAASFDGADDFVSVGTSASLSPTARTITAWIYPRSLGELNFGVIMTDEGGFGDFKWSWGMCSNDGNECPSAANTFVYFHNSAG